MQKSVMGNTAPPFHLTKFNSSLWRFLCNKNQGRLIESENNCLVVHIIYSAQESCMDISFDLSLFCVEKAGDQWPR